MKLLKDANLTGKEVLARVDFNVPLDPQGGISDETRIRAALPTIKAILNSGAEKTILISHLGRPVVRPKEKVQNIIAGNRNLTLKSVAARLAYWLKIDKKNFNLIEYNNSPLPVYKITPKLYLMENIRFLDGEGKNDPALVKTLASLGEIFIFDAFSTAHRAHASVVGLAKVLPVYAGLLLEKEIKALSILLKNPAHPLVLVLGGAKIADKILVLKNLVKKVDFVLLGGVMANTFLATRNIDMKNSVVEKDALTIADELMSRYAKKIILPVDMVWERGKIVDIGKSTMAQYAHYLGKAKMIFANGTMGLTSMGIEKFARGTKEMLAEIAKIKGAKKIICGGDTIAEVNKLKIASKFNFISTGGGATLEFLAGEKLPGLEALK